ncbi:MAG: hypothetical protein KAS01_02400 [Candidatus Pacebacteria bacterium]|nr:hypothetical protein [Candidatus Paceibacterota bacterium]
MGSFTKQYSLCHPELACHPELVEGSHEKFHNTFCHPEFSSGSVVY